MPGSASCPPRRQALRGPSWVSRWTAYSTCVMVAAGMPNTAGTYGFCGGCRFPGPGTALGSTSLRYGRPGSATWSNGGAAGGCRAGIGLTQVRRDLLAVMRLSRLTPGLASSLGPAELTRQSLEGYLAALAAEVAHPKTRRGDIGAVTGFLKAVRQHRWATLPADADLYPDDCPRPEQPTLSRAIPEFVMNQLEAPANLDRVGDPRIRLLIEILIGTGLRIGDATRLGIDCLVHDPAAATCLRYRNHKMRREALVPIDEQLAAKVADQQRRTRAAHPDTNVLLPRTHANPDGRHPIGPNTFDMHLKQWLTAGVPQLERLRDATSPDELIVTTISHDHAITTIGCVPISCSPTNGPGEERACHTRHRFAVTSLPGETSLARSPGITGTPTCGPRASESLE
jgi:site-specific recombinase XerD